MTALNAIEAIWGIIVTALVALLIYRAQLAQRETDQLFLSETAPTLEHEENDEIIRRVEQLEPICRGVGGAAALATMLLLGTWVLHQLAQSNLI